MHFVLFNMLRLTASVGIHSQTVEGDVTQTHAYQNTKVGQKFAFVYTMFTPFSTSFFTYYFSVLSVVTKNCSSHSYHGDLCAEPYKCQLLHPRAPVCPPCCICVSIWQLQTFRGTWQKICTWEGLTHGGEATMMPFVCLEPNEPQGHVKHRTGNKEPVPV